MNPSDRDEVQAPDVPDGQDTVAACIRSARSHRQVDLKRARQDAQRGLDLLRSLQTPQSPHADEEAELLTLLASFDRQDGHIESAVVRLLAALRLIGDQAASPVACEAWIGLGWVYALSGEFSRALRYSLQGLKVARSQGAPDRESHALDLLGTVYAMFGDSVEALRHLSQAAEMARAAGDRRRLCSVLNNLAMTLLDSGELAPALDAARESLRIAGEDSLAVTRLNVIDTVACVLTAMGELAEAEGMLVPAVSEARARSPGKRLATLLGSLGAIRAASGDAAQAESLHGEALEIATRIGDPVLARQCHKRLADLFAQAGRWQEAYAEFRSYHELNESVAGAKAAKRLTVVRIADEIEARQEAIDPAAPRSDGVSTIGALEALTARLRARNRELAEAKQAADAASETKSRFLTNMSHELRTPLNGVLGMAQLLMRTKLDDTQKGYCRTLLESGRTLNGLVTDILEHTRIQAGRFVVEIAELAPARLVDEVLNPLHATAAAHPLHILGTVDDGVPTTLLGDGKRIRQVLQHLVGNALKFTPAGTVELKLTRLEPHQADPRVWVRFAVRDTGIGLNPASASTLFEPFVQADDSSTRRHGGSGLGLAISRQLVELMGGSLQVRSEPGQGSTFWFDIPLRLPPAADPDN